MDKKKKRYYKEQEWVWSIEQQKPVKVIEIKKDELKIVVQDEKGEQFKYDLWKVDRLRGKLRNLNRTTDKLLFAKVNPESDAKIPSKNEEDAGYDIYASFPDQQMLLPKHKVTLVPTGIASAMPPKYYLNLKHERGSTGKLGMSVLAGVVDSGYRGEIFVAICPLVCDVLITKGVDEVQEVNEFGEKVYYYPYHKAIAQATLEEVKRVVVEEVTIEQLKAIPSKRGEGSLGSSGK